MSKCENKGRHIGIFVRTLSANIADKPACSLTGQGTIRHMVIVHNLMLYPAEIACAGRISSIPQLIHFLPLRAGIPGVSVNIWQGSVNLGPRSDHTFAHAMLVPVIPGAGDETINTNVSIEWPERGRGKALSMDIKVNT